MDHTLTDIGTGIYTVPEAARILNLPTHKVSDWIRRYWEMEFINDFSDAKNGYTQGEGRERVFNFYTLIELITVATFRELSVPFRNIKKAHQVAADMFKTRYPFAVRGFMTDGKRVIHNVDEITSLILDEKKQLEFRKLIEPFCKKIDFDEVTNIAERYWPLGRKHHIVIDPDHRFGEPVIEGTNISASIIHGLVEAGEPISFIADEYDISEDDIRDVMKFYKRAS